MKAQSEFSRGSSRGKGVMELSKMTAMEVKLDAIMHRMDKQERKMHTAHEIEAVERELIRRSAEVPTKEDSYGAEDVKYVNEQRSYHFKPNPNPPTHYNPALRNHENFSYGGGALHGPRQEQHLKNRCCSSWGTTRGYYTSMNKNYQIWKLSNLILKCFRRTLVPY